MTDFAQDLEAYISALVSRMTLPHKVRLISGADYWTTVGDASIGLEQIVFSDGPVGVRGKAWDEGDPSLCLPSPTAFAATWDEELVAQLAELLAAEAHRKGVHVLLGPTLNLHRSPLGGRHFECFSEDPLLTGRIGAVYVRALQRYGVGATPKHFVANDSENERRTVDVRVDERTLREVYLAPFEEAVAAGAWLMMSAYNGVNGHTMTEHPLLRNLLKTEWGFDGVVVSDWTAVRSTVPAAKGANDLAMPGPAEVWGAPLITAVRSGQVPEEAIDAKVCRILRLASRVGALVGVPQPKIALPQPLDVRKILRAAAARATVLLHNRNGLLPLDRRCLRRLAVIGPNAAVPQIQGGGSSSVVPPYTVSPLEGIRDAVADDVEVTHNAGTGTGEVLYPIPPDLLTDPSTSETGVEVRFLDSSGAVIRIEHHRAAALMWAGDPVPAATTIELRTQLRSREDGEHGLGVIGEGRFRLEVERDVIFDAAIQSSGSPARAQFPYRAGIVEFTAGKPVNISLVHTLESGAVGAAMALAIVEPTSSDDAKLEAAIADAKAADVAVVVVGTTSRLENEGFDRGSIVLPGRQAELVRRVAAANPRTVVVVNAGAPVDLSWSHDAAALLVSWFPGQEFGDALADVLFGVREPSGRLPTTWPNAQEDVPVLNTRPHKGRLKYNEALHIGYRAWALADTPPAYPFGHGLGYTTWEYRGLHSDASLTAGDGTVASVHIANTGSRRGRHVVQVYLRRPESEIDRPALWLAGFATVVADPGEHKEVPVVLAARTFQHWSTDEGQWRNEFGAFTMLAGPSSAELLLQAQIVVESSRVS